MRPTRSSKTLQSAKRRLERLNSITPIPDFGTGFSIVDYGQAIDDLELLEAGYNKTVSLLDFKLTELRSKEKEIRDLRERILTAIAFQYGKDSEEYVAAGGIRKSERKRRTFKISPSAPMSEN